MATKRKSAPTNDHPTLTLKDAWIDESMGPRHNFLWGTAVDHPDEKFNDKRVHSSYIIKVEGNVVETKRAVYNILNWDTTKVHPQGELF